MASGTADSVADYLILGGGSAGCVLANRLSGLAGVRVVLVEAGMDLTHDTAPADVLSNFPGKAYFNPAFTWPDLRAGFGGWSRNDPAGRPRGRYEQARLLGGGSSINGLIANRGAPTDYDEWAAMGAEGWTWDNVLPHFRQLERDLDFDGPFHGSDGPVAIRRFPVEDWSGFTRAVAGALEARGFARIADQNGEWRDGLMPVTASVDEEGRRVSCAFAYLTPEVRARPNLQIHTRTQVLRILFEGRRATGAEVLSEGRRLCLKARNVILSCGAIHSPAVLMRSGIGPGATLQRLAIPVIANRPGVGQNLQEHPVVSVSCFLQPAARMTDLHRHHTQAHLRFSSGAAECPAGDMCLAIIARSGWHAMGHRVGSLYFWVNKSFSRGNVGLTSADPDALPEVDFRMLSDPRDLERLRAAFRMVADLARDPALDTVRTEVFPANYSDRVRRVSRPGLVNELQMRLFAGLLDAAPAFRGRLLDRLVSQGRQVEALLADDATLDAYLQESVVGVWHPVGTCRMGAPDDPMAVTDARGRVLGVDGLRVCDASLMPGIPSANTNIPTIMVAERIAHMIASEIGQGGGPKEAQHSQGARSGAVALDRGTRAGTA